MKFLNVTLLSLILAPYALATPAGDLSLTPTSVKLKLYKFAVSTSPLCTNLTTVIDNGNSPTEVDFAGAPNLGSGTVSNGTYPCVAMEVSDNIRYIPGANSASGACVAGTTYTLDICRTDNSGTSQMIDGTTTTCTGATGSPSADRVTFYLSTYSDPSGNGDGFYPPTVSGGNGTYLSSALVVSGSATNQFVADPTGQMCDNTNDSGSDCDGPGAASSCQLEGVAVSFR